MGKPLTVLDLCSGAAGGWSLGLHRAGMTTVAACEAVEWRRRMFSANFPGIPVYEDLRSLAGAQLLGDLGAFPSVIAGSPPCKEYSAANHKAGGLDADDLFLHAVRLVGECRPRWCAFENSDLLRTRGYDRIADALEALGYTCWPLVVGVGNTGASHKRKRLIIIGLDTHAESQPARAARQPRVGSDANGAERPLGRGGAWGRWSRCEEEGEGAFAGAIARLASVFRGPAGSEPLGRHLRAYDGLPTRLAEQCREAYGDAVAPQITEAVGRAILQVDAASATLERAA